MTEADLDWEAPRVPVCTARGLSCPFTGPCFEPGARDGLVVYDDDDAMVVELDDEDLDDEDLDGDDG